MLCQSKLFHWKGFLKLSTFLLIFFVHTSNLATQLPQLKQSTSQTNLLSTMGLEPMPFSPISLFLFHSPLTFSATLTLYYQVNKNKDNISMYGSTTKEDCLGGPLGRTTLEECLVGALLRSALEDRLEGLPGRTNQEDYMGGPLRGPLERIAQEDHLGGLLWTTAH